MILNDDQIESLLAFVGYGDLAEAQIAFLMNEGGLGDKSVEENIRLITEEYKGYTDTWLDGDWKNGYWKINRWEPNQLGKAPRSPFLRLVSRMVMALENEESTEACFQKGNANLNSQVREFLVDGGLFSERPGVKTALVDWRPLPRVDEENPLPYDNVDQELYLAAFRYEGTEENPYIGWREHRIEIIQNMFQRNSVPILICSGDPDAKKGVISEIFGNVEYNEIALPKSGDTIFVSKNKVGRNTTVIICKFMSYEHFGYAATRDLTDYVRKLLTNSGTL